ncbi:MAG: hypothetical protein A4S09_05575 [Proteobacteria bacterium SG_bin7]|nr:MAG: hypothetical protein A4S09_05575 [Proteobacteria bacterium SG_bin7]
MRTPTLILSFLFSMPCLAGEPQCHKLFEKEGTNNGFLENIRGSNVPDIDFLGNRNEYDQPNFLITTDGATAFLMNYGDQSKLFEIGSLGTSPKVTRFNQTFKKIETALTKDRLKIIQLYFSEDSTVLRVLDKKTGRQVRHEVIPWPRQRDWIFKYVAPGFSVYTTGPNTIKILSHSTLRTRTITTPFELSKIVVNPEGYLAALSAEGIGDSSVTAFKISTGERVSQYNFGFKLTSLDAVMQQGRSVVLRQESPQGLKLEIYNVGKDRPIFSQNVSHEIGSGMLNSGKTFYHSHGYDGKIIVYTPEKQRDPVAVYATSNNENEPKAAPDRNSLLFTTEHGYKVFDALTSNVHSFRNSQLVRSDNINSFLGVNRTQNKVIVVTHEDDPQGETSGVTRIVEINTENKTTKIQTEVDNMNPRGVVGSSDVQMVWNRENLITYSLRPLSSIDAAPKAEKFLNAIAEHFNSGIYLNEPETTLRLILQLGELSPSSINEILKKYPQVIATLEKLDPLTPRNRTDEISLRNQAEALLANLNPGNLTPTEVARLFRPLIKIMDSQKLSEAVIKFANQILKITETSTSPEINLIPSYNRFKLIKEEIKRQLGLPWKAISDVVVNYDQNLNAKVVIFGSSPIDNSTPNELGFHSIIKSEFKVDRARTATVSWRHGNKRQSATIKSRPLNAKDIRPTRSDGPDYDSMLKDKVLGGAVVIPPNMDDGDGFGAELASNYKSFYKSQGYKFESANMTGTQAISFLLEKVESREIDYLVREGHSEAQTDSLVTFGNQVNIEIGRKIVNGIEEIINIFGPGKNRGNAADGAILSFSVLGRHLRGRNESSNFIFLQTACFSSDDLGRYVGMVASRGFIPLATNRSAETFVNEKSSPIRMILAGILGRKPWAAMRSDDLAIERYIFPDEDQYNLEGMGDRSKTAEIYIQRDYNVVEENDGKN